MHTELVDSAYYVDLSQEIVGTTRAGTPIYDYVNGRDNFMLTNSSFDASSDVLSVLLTKRWDWGLDASLGYAYTDSEDISPMTSSVAGSNFDNLATLDINNPRPATSNYEVPNRFSLRASIGRDFIEGFETRFTVFAYLQEGQPQSFAMGSGDLEGDGFFGRHLLNVPTGVDDPNVVFADGFATNDFFDWVSREGLSPGFTERNGQHARWSNRFDLGVYQDFPVGFSKLNGRFFVRLYNVGNFIDDDYGKVYDAFFFTPQVVRSSVNDDGQFVYESFTDRGLTDLLENRSLWQARFGAEIRF